MTLNNLNLSSGIILLDKSEGISSNTAMQKIRRGLKIKKMGHTGTLDPLATGMLPLCFGKATRLCSYFLDANKTYQTRIALGEKRATGDREGAVIDTQEVPEFSQEKLEQVLSSFVGVQSQIPPMFSALKKDGKALYELAREGIEIDREPREINIYEIKLLEFGKDFLELIISCSKGTYIRTLGEDIAQALGTVGYLASLKRLSCGNFKESQMHSEQAILTNPEDKVLTLEQALNWPAIKINSADSTALLQGKSPKISVKHTGLIFLKSEESGEIIGFGEGENQRLKWRTFLI